MVSEKVGMPCFGSLSVRTCSKPSSPNQFRSLINSVIIRHEYQSKTTQNLNQDTPLESVVRSRATKKTIASQTTILKEQKKQNRRTRIMEHDDDIVKRHMNVY